MRVPVLAAALLTAAIPLASVAQPSATPPAAPAQVLAQANAALQAGEADKALALLESLPASGPNEAEAHSLICRVRLSLEQFDAAANECEHAVRLGGQNSDDHLWLGRALGEKADRASFLTAFSLAKRTRAEFEEAVRLNPRNAEALVSLGEFYRQAPGVVGGGVDKALEIAAQLDKVDPERAHEFRGRLAEQQKNFTAAEGEFKQAIAAGPHPAFGWNALACFFLRRQRFAEMESAMHSVLSTAERDRHAGVALYDGAGQLIESNRDPALAAAMLDEYLANSSKTEEAPAFIAHIRLARLKEQLGDPAAAARERAAALALASQYKPAQEFKAPDPQPQQARF
jgi:tetratricopeptide (TPR) repeat protein